MSPKRDAPTLKITVCRHASHLVQLSWQAMLGLMAIHTGCWLIISRKAVRLVAKQATGGAWPS
jgi:hypothetical protein